MGSKLTIKNNDNTEFTIEHIDGEQAKSLTTKDFKYIRDTIKDLSTINNPSDGDVVLVKGYHSVNDGGGGLFIYHSDELKANHNGGTIIDATKTFPNDWSNQTELTSWFTGNNTGNGCWKRVYEDTVNVKWFGAKGDEVNNDAISINKAISSANKITGNGGSFYVSETLVINNDKELYDINISALDPFNGNIYTYSYYDTGSHDTSCVLYANNCNLALKNVSINCKAIEDKTQPISLVILDSCKKVLIESGDYSYNSGENTSLSGGAIFILDTEETKINNIKMTNILGEGIHSRSDDVYITNSYFDTSTSSLISSQRRNNIDKETYNLHVINCTLKNADNAALSCNSVNSILSGNNIEYNGYGINIGHRTTYARRAPADNTIVDGNSIKICKQGINVAYGEHITVSNNYIHSIGIGASDNINAGIRCTYWGSTSNIVANIIENALVGICINGYASNENDTKIADFTISNNIIKNIQRYGILSTDTNKLLISGNQIFNCNIASDIDRGTPIISDRTLAKSVLPDPVGPISNILLFSIFTSPLLAIILL
jgi:hypothetical protein